jgi:hypothetical protein
MNHRLTRSASSSGRYPANRNVIPGRFGCRLWDRPAARRFAADLQVTKAALEDLKAGPLRGDQLNSGHDASLVRICWRACLRAALLLQQFQQAWRCFRAAVERGEFIAHVFGLNAGELERIARAVGVKRTYIDRPGTQRQHHDLCGAPLKRLLDAIGQGERFPNLQPTKETP